MKRTIPELFSLSLHNAEDVVYAQSEDLDDSEYEAFDNNPEGAEGPEDFDNNPEDVVGPVNSDNNSEDAKGSADFDNNPEDDDDPDTFDADF